MAKRSTKKAPSKKPTKKKATKKKPATKKRPRKPATEPPKPPGQPGRPTKCTPEITDEICMRLAEGESLRSICDDEHMPTKNAVLLWVVQDREGFSNRYRDAREAAGYSHADTLVDIANQLLDGGLDPKAARVASGNLQWAAERMAPKKHSPRYQYSGVDEGPIPLEGLTEEQLDARILQLLSATEGDGGGSGK